MFTETEDETGLVDDEIMLPETKKEQELAKLKNMYRSLKTWLADPGLGAQIIVKPSIRKLNKDTRDLHEWKVMVPRENHKKGRLHALVIANMTVTSKGKGGTSGLAFRGAVCGKKSHLHLLFQGTRFNLNVNFGKMVLTTCTHPSRHGERDPGYPTLLSGR